MEKKIGELTLKEAQQICNSKPLGVCKDCPLYDLCQCSFDYNDEDLEQVIEVEENA